MSDQPQYLNTNYFAVILTKEGQFLQLQLADQARGFHPQRLYIFGTPATAFEIGLSKVIEPMAATMNGTKVQRFLSIRPGDVPGVAGLSADVIIDEVGIGNLAE